MHKPDEALNSFLDGLCRILQASLNARWALISTPGLANPAVSTPAPPPELIFLAHKLQTAAAFEQAVLQLAGVKAACAAAIHSADGVVVGIVAAFHDQPHTYSPSNRIVLDETARIISRYLTHHQTSSVPEAVLNQGEERFSPLFEQNVMGIVYVDPQGKWLRVNQKFLDMLGYTTSEFYRLTIADFTHPDDLMADMKYIERMQSGEIDEYSLDKRYIRKDGSIMHGVLRVTKVRSSDGWIMYYIGHIVDVTEQKQADERITYQANLLANVTDAVISTDLSFNIRSWNQGAEAIYGYTAEEAIGNPVNTIVRQELSAEETAVLQEQLIARGSWRGEVLHFHKDGHFIHIFAHVSLVHDPHGHLLGAVAVNRDITEKKRADQNLQHTMKQLADLKFALDQSAIVAITDQRGNILEANDKFAEISGYSRDELIGKDHEIVNSGYHPREFIRNLWTTIAGGRVWHGEIRNRSKTGEIYWVDTTIVPFLTDRGKPYQYIAIRYDTTQRKLAEDALRRSNQEITNILESIGDAFYAVNRQWQFTYVNRHAKVLLNRPIQELIGSNLWDIFPEAANVLTHHHYHTVMNIGTPIQFEDYYPSLHSWFDVRVYPSETGISVYFSNINARKEHERQQFQLAMERERVDILADFIQSASHDFRTPLSIIKTNLYLMSRVNDPEQRKGYLDTLNEQTISIEILVNDMLEMNRLKSQSQFTLIPCRLNELVSIAVEHLAEKAAQKEITITANLAAYDIFVKADPTEIQRAVINILTNAIQFTPSAGSVTITTCSASRTALIDVRDTGIGISDDVRPHIFTPFFRGDKARTTRGAGLGLSIAQRIVEAHDGTIELVESRPGEGALFRITLPLMLPEASDHPD